MLIAINDPRRLTEDDFLAGFVARTETADFLIDQLRQMTSSGEGRHRLIVGQRGMGKTSLLRRIAIGVTRDGDLAARYVPLTFREEQYNVRSVDQFLRNCGEALAEWLEQSGNDKSAREIDQSLRTEKWRNPAGACETFHLLISALGLRPLLLVDNLDLIFDAMPSEQHWQLRRMLQNRGGPVLYGASTQIPQQFSDREEAFYEFFQIHPLEPLSQSELIRCLYRLTEARGESGRSVKDLLDREPERLRVLHTLTGGNPRVLVLIYQLLERAENQAVFADLEALLDQMTPFYKSRIEELKSDLQRAILDAIALNWDPITSHEISKITGVELTTVSPQLQRLRNQGLVEEVPTSGSRSGYQIIERFLNIWYLMRHGTRRARHRMRWLAAFLKSFYSIDQLRHLRETLCANPEGGPWQPIYDVAIAEALEKVNRELEHGGRELVPQTDRSSLEMEKAEADLRSAIASKPNSTTAWIKLGDFLAKETTRFEEAESAYRRALEINGNDAAPWHRLGRLLRTRLIAWFKDAGHDLTNAPIYAAFVAFVKGPRALLDFNPEVRQPARVIYSWLTSQGGAPQQGMTEKPPPRRRGPRKRRL